jgi:hypothetical protein
LRTTFSAGRVGAGAVLRARRDFDRREAELHAGRVPVVAGDQPEAIAARAHGERGDHSARRDRAGQRVDVRRIERADVGADVDQCQRDALLEHRQGPGHATPP